MGHRPKHKMSREDRAKQFMPFAALKGFEEAILAKEQQVLGIYEGICGEEEVEDSEEKWEDSLKEKE